MKFVVLKKKKFLIILAVFLALTLSIVSMCATKSYSVFYGSNLRELPIYRVKTEKKQIAITFDCAWGVDYTDELLSIMEEKNIKSTFFMVEFWAKKYPEYVKKIYEKGHAIGTHSATHPHMAKLNKETIELELSTSKNQIEKVINDKICLFRAPFGEYNDLVINTAKSMGLYTIQWDVDSLDWKDLSKNEIVNRVVNKVSNGSIILCHNNGLNTAKALPEIIDKLIEKGYEFIRVDQLIYKDNYKMNVNGEQVLNV